MYANTRRMRHRAQRRRVMAWSEVVLLAAALGAAVYALVHREAIRAAVVGGDNGITDKLGQVLSKRPKDLEPLEVMGILAGLYVFYIAVTSATPYLKQWRRRLRGWVRDQYESYELGRLRRKLEAGNKELVAGGGTPVQLPQRGGTGKRAGWETFSQDLRAVRETFTREQLEKEEQEKLDEAKKIAEYPLLKWAENKDKKGARAKFLQRVTDLPTDGVDWGRLEKGEETALGPVHFAEYRKKLTMRKAVLASGISPGSIKTAWVKTAFVKWGINSKRSLISDETVKEFLASVGTPEILSKDRIATARLLSEQMARYHQKKPGLFEGE